jgi:hypothetical protein
MEAVEVDSSPVDTSPGAPAAIGGDGARACRILTARGLPPWRDDAAAYIRDLRSFDRSHGLPEFTSVSALITKRTGPTRKPTKLFENTEGGLVARYEADGMYCRARLVYMIPDFVNRVLLPVVIGLKVAFKRTLGFYHGPAEELDQLAVMRSNGGRIWEADFSSMDRTFTPAHRNVIIECMIAQGWPVQPLLFLRALEDVQSVMYPSWLGRNRGLTYLSGPKGLLSGLLVTSAFDTLHNAAATITSLSLQFGSTRVRRLFEEGRLGFRAQGDDSSLALPKELDNAFRPDEHVAVMAACSGFITMKEGLVFLKKIQALGPRADAQTTGLLSRGLIQNTFWNETPAAIPAIARIGLAARLENIQHHPCWELVARPAMTAISKSLHFAKTSPLPTDEDREALLQYVASQEGGAYLSTLLDSLFYRPTAARELKVLRDLGITPDSAADYFKQAVVTRRAIMEGVLSTPNGEDVKRIAHMIWRREIPDW